MAIDNEKKSSRLLASRRYTHDTLASSQEAFTQVLDLGASEIYSETNLIPTSSLPFSGSTQQRGTEGVLKYYYRQKLTPSNLNNEVWFFRDPPGSDDGIGAQLIDDNQQTNFISPKYSVTALANANTEDSPSPGYNVKVFKSTSTNSGSLTNTSLVSSNDYEFDYKTGVLQFLSSTVDPSDSEYVYITAYQYVGKTLSEKVVTNEVVADSFTGTFVGALSSSVQIKDDVSGSLGTNANLIRSLTATSISESLGTNATLIRSLTATSISESLGTNATLIRSLTATSISESLGTNATLIRSLTATSISESFNEVSASFSGRVHSLEGTGVFTPTSISESLGDNANLIRSLTATSISESLGTNATLIRSLTATSISESLGTNATLIRSLTATSISESLGTNATLIRSLTATSISESFNTVSASLALETSESLAVIRNNTLISSSAQIADNISGSWQNKNFQLSSGTASFTAITASGNITASGLLFASASSAPTHTDSILAVVYDTSSGQFYYTGSYGSGGGNTFTAAEISGSATKDINELSASFALDTNVQNVSSSAVTASNLLVNESARIFGSFALNGVQLIEDVITVNSGSTKFGSGSFDTDVQLTTHEFTGSVFITGSDFKFNGVDVMASSFTPTSISESFNQASSSINTTITAVSNSLVTTVTAVSNSLVTTINGIESGTGVGFPFEGTAIITGSLTVSGGLANEDVTLFADVIPGNDDEYTLGTSGKKWNAVFATNTFFGGIHEINLETTGIGQLQAGTVLVSKAGQMVPCTQEADPLVMAIVATGSDYPIILGAEPVLVVGPVYEGDYIITSNVTGHGKAVNPSQIYSQQLFGKIIAQSLESKTEGGIIRAMIRKM